MDLADAEPAADGRHDGVGCGAVPGSARPDTPAHRPGGVDAWTDKTVWAVFIPVFTYAGVSLLVVGCVAGVVRSTPLSELPEPRDRWAAAAAVINGRPASRASARRMARALLITNACLGVGLLPLCLVQWRTSGTADVPAWLLPGTLALFLLATLPLGVAWRRDAAERRAA